MWHYATVDPMATATFTPLLPRPQVAPAICDAYRVEITNPEVTDIDAAVRAFFGNSPAWLGHLMRARNAVVKRLGFATNDDERRELPQRFELGDAMGPFTILERSNHEIVMGGDDTHYSFRLSMWIPEGTRTLQATTHGHHHSRLGRVYLAIVKPGHRLIAPMMVKRAARP